MKTTSLLSISKAISKFLMAHVLAAFTGSFVLFIGLTWPKLFGVSNINDAVFMIKAFLLVLFVTTILVFPFSIVLFGGLEVSRREASDRLYTLSGAGFSVGLFFVLSLLGGGLPRGGSLQSVWVWGVVALSGLAAGAVFAKSRRKL